MIEAVTQIMKKVNDNDIVVSSTGIPSRVVYTVKDRPLNFYVMGSMGASLGIGIGIALNTDKTVHVIAGDGDILMSLGTVVLMNKLNLNNLYLYVLDNGCYCATGGQPTCSKHVDFERLAKRVKVFNISRAKPEIGRINLSPEEITKRFMRCNVETSR